LVDKAIGCSTKGGPTAMKRPRFTVRRLMVAVAVAGLLIAGWIEGERRRVRFLAIADDHSWGADSAIGVISREKMAWHETMEGKYERAARYPWLPVPPDPPEPE
jgi:hypothetical protein